MERGKFIVFEGIDGSGKTTQIRMLATYLKGRGLPVCTACEPTSSPFGGLLRECLSRKREVDEHTIAALFAADRLHHVFDGESGLLKELGEGTTVLCDRFYLSSMAYNGGEEAGWVEELNRAAIRALHPDLTLFLDVSPAEAMRRIERRGVRERYESASRLEAVRRNYFRLFEQIPGQNVRVIGSGENKEETQRKIRAAVDQLFGGRS